MTTSFNDPKLFAYKYDKSHDQDNVFGDTLRMNDFHVQSDLVMTE